MYSQKFKTYDENIQFNFFKKQKKKPSNILDFHNVDLYEKHFTNDTLSYKTNEKNIICSGIYDLKNIYNLDLNLVLEFGDIDLKWLKNKKIRNNLKICKNNNFNLEWFNLFDDDFIESNPRIFTLLSNNLNFKKSWFMKYPNSNWNYKEITKNIKFDLECFNKIKTKLNLNMNYCKVFLNKKFNMEWIDEDLDWNYNDLINSYNFDIDWLEKYGHKITFHNPDLYYSHPNFQIEWLDNLRNYFTPTFNGKLSFSKNLNEKWIQMYPQEDWDTNGLKTNDNYSCEWMIKYPYLDWKSVYNHWNYIAKMKECSDFKIEYFQKYPTLNWNYREICCSIYFDISWLEINPILKKMNNLYLIIDNVNFNIDWVIENPDLEWCFSSISFKKQFDIKLLKLFPKKKWSMTNICANPNFKIEYLEICPDLKNYTYYVNIKENKNFTIDWIYKYPRLMWKSYNLSEWPKLTYEIFMNTEDEIGINKVVWDKYLLYNYNFRKSFTKHNLNIFDKVVKIQNWWLSIYYSPRTRVGQERFKRKFEELLD